MTHPLEPHLDKLERSSKPGKFNCPACGGDNLSVNATTFAHECYDNCCTARQILDVIALFQPNDRPIVSRQISKKAAIAAPIPQGLCLEIPRLADIPSNIPKPFKRKDHEHGEVLITHYPYSNSQHAERKQWDDATKPKGYDKSFFPYHLEGDQLVCGKGKKAWEAYRLEEAIAASIASRSKLIFSQEGETCVELGRSHGIPSFTFQGGSWSGNDIAIVAARLKVEGLVWVHIEDNDDAGRTKTRKLREKCAEAKVPFIAIPITSICLEVPEKGDLKECLELVDVETFISLLSKAIQSAIAMPSRIAEPELGSEARQMGETIKEKQGLILEAEPQELEWRCLDSHQCQIGAWSKESEFTKPQDVSDWKQRAKSNPIGVEIRVSSEDGQEVAWVKFFNPKADFDFSVSKILTASDGGGLMLALKRVESGQVVEIEAYIKSTETGKVTDFINALKRETGRNLCCTLELKELQALIQSRTSRYRRDGGRTYRLAPVTGQQEDGTWVLDGLQFKEDGTITSEDESLWIFNRTLGETEQIPSPNIAQQSPDALKRLVAACKAVINPEVLPLVLFNIGYNTATLQRKEIMKLEHQMPQLTQFGEIGGCKTLASMIGASLTGMHRFVLNKFSESSLYERLKSLSGFGVVLDDPIKPGKNSSDRKEQVDGLLWDLYNGFSRKVRGNEQIPRSNIVVNTNIALGEGTQAVESRVIKLYYPVLPTIGDDAAETELTEAMNGASGGLGQVLAIKYDKSAVKDIQRLLFALLPHSHKRISGSLALVTYFTQKFCDVAGLEFDAFTYCKEHLCPSADEFESNKDSLTDFLEKLGILKAEGIAGEWNLTQVSKGGKPYLAIHLPAIWGEFERRFNPNYSRQSLQQLAEGKGGEINSSQKFVSDKIEWLDYQRAKAEYERRDYSNWQSEEPPPPPPKRPNKTAARKCLLIPDRVVSEILGDDSSDILSTNFSNYSTEASPDVEPKVTQKLPDSQKLPAKLPLLVTCETQAEKELQPKVTQVTQVTEETMPIIERGTKVEFTATGETGLVVELEDGFATIKLDTPIQAGGSGRKFMGCSLAEIRALPSNPNVFKVGDRVRYEMQFWNVDKIRADGTLYLGHATLLKATSANPAEVELVEQGVAA